MARTDDDRDSNRGPGSPTGSSKNSKSTPQTAPDQQWPDPATPEVDEADLLEQVHEVLVDPDEEYTPNPP